MKRLMIRSLSAMMLLSMVFIVSCSGNGERPSQDAGTSSSEAVGIEESVFGSLGPEQEAQLFTIRNSNGMEVKITNYGGTVTSIVVPDNQGELENVVLGFDNLDDYLSGHPFFGSLIGRYANRIAGGVFELDGQQYTLATNNGENHLHGGEQGFDKVLWDAQINSDSSLELTYLSEDGEEGYPGNLQARVTYSLSEENELVIDYEANADQATPVNLTNHSYFNLSGNTSTDILDHILFIDADRYTPVDEGLIPTGELRPVEGTPFDFTEPFRIGERIEQVEGGYDHNFVLSEMPVETPRLVATLREPESGRKMEVYTTEPGVQLYTGNFLDGSITDGSGNTLEQHAGLCLETQHFPNSPNESSFPSTILREDETYQTTTIYKFLVE